MDKPSFQPSILWQWGDVRCHSYVTDGRIQFLNDCTHDLAGQTVDLPEYLKNLEVESPNGKEEAMPEIFNEGDQVVLKPENLLGVQANVVMNTPQGVVCVITSDDHPSGHSARGTLVLLTADELKKK